MKMITKGPDGKMRCRWCEAAPEFLSYHDKEWGFPVLDDFKLFEKLCLEGFQSGLSWRTILVKRENFRKAFLWKFEPDPKQTGKPQSASTSAHSIALSKALKKMGWKFVGPTTVYAFMQAMRLFNDHAEGCVVRKEVEKKRKKFRRPKTSQ